MTIANAGLQAADLQNRYNQESIAQNFGKFLAQHAFGQQRKQNDLNFQQNFPRFTGRWAGQLGRAGNVRSGVMGEQMNQMNQDFLNQQGQINFQEAQTMGRYAQEAAARKAALERALAALSQNLYG